MKKENHILRTAVVPVVTTLSGLAEVKAIVCFGSYALGTADQHSDVDLYVFCQPRIVSAAARRVALQKVHGVSDLKVDHAEFGWDNQWCPKGDRFRLGDHLFDVTFNTLDWTRTVVRKVVEEGATSIPELRFRPYTMLGLLATCVILHDPEGVMQEFKSTIRPYPPRLKKALIAESLRTMKGSLEDLQDYVKRGIGNTAFLFHLERFIDSLTELIFAHNERYNPATKRVEEAYRELRILPNDFLRRYKAVLETPLTAAGRRKVARELQALAEEIEMLANEKAEQSHQGRPG